jgi:23S rRNA pseudouridine2605 synthase
MRIAKFLSDSGICSRREGERLVEEGRIKINDIRVTHPSQKVEEQDVVSVDNKSVERRTSRKLWAFHKPRECVTSRTDPSERSTVYDILPKSLEQAKYIGRLDYWSEGLLLFTNDGEFARELSLPIHEIPRMYKVRVYGEIPEHKLAVLRKGAVIDGIRYKPMKIEALSDGSKNAWLSITLYEGKNREIRRAIEFIGAKVNRLIRVAFGPVELGNLKMGDVKEISPKLFTSFLEKEKA